MKSTMKRTVAGILAAVSLMTLGATAAFAEDSGETWHQATKIDDNTFVIDPEAENEATADEDEATWQQATKTGDNTFIINPWTDPVVE